MDVIIIKADGRAIFSGESGCLIPISKELGLPYKIKDNTFFIPNRFSHNGKVWEIIAIKANGKVLPPEKKVGLISLQL